MHARASLALAAVPALLAACGSTPPPSADGGVDAGPGYACDSPTMLEGVMGGTVSASFDTTATATLPRDLGLYCGNTDPTAEWAPQEVVALRVPGDGPVAVLFDSAVDGTDADFNTVIQMRRDCRRAPGSDVVAPLGIFPSTCFDDVDFIEVRARGGVMAMGGETLFFYVTGWSAPPPEWMMRDRGRVRVEFTVRPNGAPAVDSGSVRVVGEDVVITVSGRDPDGDVRGVALNFLNPFTGELIDVWGDGDANEEGDVIVVPFEPAPTDVDYTAVGRVYGTELTLGRYLAANRPTVRLRVFDSATAIAPPIDVPVE